MKNLYYILLIFISSTAIFAHGRSEKLTKILNEPVPEWMSLAETIKVNPSLKKIEEIDKSEFRDKSGGATNSRNRVHIASINLTHQFDYYMVWTGGNEKSLGVSLKPDGSQLLTSSGTDPYFRVYTITDTNTLEEREMKLPTITYDKGLKGFINSWHWASDDTLIGNATINDEKGHELVESRIYVYCLKTKSLARLDLSALGIDNNNPPFISYESVKKDLSQIILEIGGKSVLVDVDLKAQHKLIQADQGKRVQN
jgi:hypothetical protein